MDVFAYCVGVVVAAEGGYSANPSDPGNWSGGDIGRGICRGTKYGISAAAHPTLDIAALTLDQARAIYRGAYWAPIQGDSLPPPLALLAFDAAVNNGVANAVRWLQAAAGAAPDGVFGPATLAALHATHAHDADALLVEFQATRLTHMVALPTWHIFGGGWARRLCALPFQALALFPQNATSTGV